MPCACGTQSGCQRRKERVTPREMPALHRNGNPATGPCICAQWIKPTVSMPPRVQSNSLLNKIACKIVSLLVCILGEKYNNSRATHAHKLSASRSPRRYLTADEELVAPAADAVTLLALCVVHHSCPDYTTHTIMDTFCDVSMGRRDTDDEHMSRARHGVNLRSSRYCCACLNSQSRKPCYSSPQPLVVKDARIQFERTVQIDSASCFEYCDGRVPSSIRCGATTLDSLNTLVSISASPCTVTTFHYMDRPASGAYQDCSSRSRRGTVHSL